MNGHMKLQDSKLGAHQWVKFWIRNNTTNLFYFNGRNLIFLAEIATNATSTNY
jgi:hypothetical protein